MVTFFYLGDIKNPPPSSAGGLSRVGAAQYATIDQPKPPGDPTRRYLTVEVNGQQYLWRYRYPNGAFSYYDMVVPYDTTVVLEHHLLRRHPLVVDPQARRQGRRDPPAPSTSTRPGSRSPRRATRATAAFTGASIFKGVCAELCGDNHADMRARVIALPVDQYQRWVEDQKAR